jgi:hypothetical protein
MRLARMGASFPTRLSFMRTLIRQLSREDAHITRPVWQIDDHGFGRAVYSVEIGAHIYSLVAFSTPLAPDQRTDRVIAEAWDTSYVLFDGAPQQEDLERLAIAAPLQEAGRYTENDLILSRANKSVRLFEHVVDCLANGRQPDTNLIDAIGYLMRTTAVYGNGKFGIADRDTLIGRPVLDGPFRAEMLIVYLIRGFTHDLIEHIAQRRNPARAVPLDRAIKRHLGIGNATGLGMAPFLVSHPRLLHNWVVARESALARVRALPTATPESRGRTTDLIERVKRHLADWSVEDARHMKRIETLRSQFADLTRNLDDVWWQEPAPWDRLVRAAETLSTDCQELVCALVLEPHGEFVDELETGMSDDAPDRIEPAMRTLDLLHLTSTHWSFALATDFGTQAETAQFWYVSEEKLEPRLGLRYHEAGADRELPLDIARRVQRLARDLAKNSADETVAAFLFRYPEHRYAARRIQIAAEYPYSEIHDNLISARCLPIDMLRFKLAFFGASKFDPRSDLWTRVTLYQGAPLFDELDHETADDWWFPVLDRPGPCTQ